MVKKRASGKKVRLPISTNVKSKTTMAQYEALSPSEIQAAFETDIRPAIFLSLISAALFFGAGLDIVLVGIRYQYIFYSASFTDVSQDIVFYLFWRGIPILAIASAISGNVTWTNIRTMSFDKVQTTVTLSIIFGLASMIIFVFYFIKVTTFFYYAPYPGANASLYWLLFPFMSSMCIGILLSFYIYRKIGPYSRTGPSS